MLSAECLPPPLHPTPSEKGWLKQTGRRDYVCFKGKAVLPGLKLRHGKQRFLDGKSKLNKAVKDSY